MPVSITTFFQCPIFVNQDMYPDWVTTVKPLSVNWGSSSGLSLLIIKSLISTELHGFIQTFIYWKPFALLPITLFQLKSFLKIVYICGNLCALKEFISYWLSGACFAHSFCEVTLGKSPKILPVSYCVRICCLALDIFPYFISGCDMIKSSNYQVPTVFSV